MLTIHVSGTVNEILSLEDIGVTTFWGLPAKQQCCVLCYCYVPYPLCLPACGGFLTNELIAKFDAFWKKLFAGVTTVSWNVCLIYCMRRMRICFRKWPTIRNIVFTSYYHPQKFSPWNCHYQCLFALPQSAILMVPVQAFICTAKFIW